MKDIEDLGDDAQCAHFVAPPTKGTPAARLHTLSGHVNMRRAGRLGTHGEDCYTCVAQCDTAAESAAPPARAPTAAELADPWHAFPIVNPFSDGGIIHLDELVAKRAGDPTSDVNAVPGITDHDEAELKQQRDFFKSVQATVEKTGHVPDEYKAFFSEGGDPRTQGGSVPEIDTNPVGQRMLKQMVENVKNPDTAPIVDANPTVLNGHTTYADAERFAAEEQVLFRESPVIVGLSGDLPSPNDYKRFEVAGKSLLLTRDSAGAFHAFENACRHRAMELVSAEAPAGNKRLHVCPYHAWAYGSDGSLMSVPFEQGFTDDDGAHATERGGLVELPSAERAGLLFVVATKVDDEHFERMMAEVMPPELQAELEIFQLDGLRRTQSQDMVIDANWKLPVDTFCESCESPRAIYHQTTWGLPFARCSLVLAPASFRLIAERSLRFPQTTSRSFTPACGRPSCPTPPCSAPSSPRIPTA